MLKCAKKDHYSDLIEESAGDSKNYFVSRTLFAMSPQIMYYHLILALNSLQMISESSSAAKSS